MKTRIALFIVALVATGCAQLPLSGGTDVATYQEPVGKVCDPTGWCSIATSVLETWQLERRGGAVLRSHRPASGDNRSLLTVESSRSKSGIARIDRTGFSPNGGAGIICPPDSHRRSP